MKAKFLGCNIESRFKFNVGNLYDVVGSFDAGEEIVKIIKDENGDKCYAYKNMYNLELVDDDELVGEEKPSLKYFINGFPVVESEFKNVWVMKTAWEDDSVDTSSIKLEVRFE
jgi:hypothetical protein